MSNINVMTSAVISGLRLLGPAAAPGKTEIAVTSIVILGDDKGVPVF